MVCTKIGGVGRYDLTKMVMSGNTFWLMGFVGYADLSYHSFDNAGGGGGQSQVDFEQSLRGLIARIESRGIRSGRSNSRKCPGQTTEEGDGARRTKACVRRMELEFSDELGLLVVP